MRKGRLLDWWEAISPLGKTLLIALAAPLLVLNAWAVFAIAEYFHSLVVILIGASLIAFLLNYPVSVMVRQGASRDRAAVIVFLFAVSVLLALGVTLGPVAFRQAQQLVLRLPEWIDSGRHQLILLNDRLEGAGFPVNLDALAGQISDRLKSQLQSIAAEVLNFAVFTVTSLLDFLLTLVLAFYLLQHGDELWHSLVEWLPARARQPFSHTLRLSFQNFFLGQFILATCMGVALTLIFLVLRVPFGLLFGLTIGTMALVPFGGSVGITLVTTLVALRDIALGLKVLGACVIVQQILENLIAPRVLGSVTGLNPVWVFIAILTGVRVGGLLGVIIAVPTAVVIKNALMLVRSYTAEAAQLSLRSPSSTDAESSPSMNDHAPAEQPTLAALEPTAAATNREHAEAASTAASNSMEAPVPSPVEPLIGVRDEG